MTTPERETAITITLRHYSHKELADAIEAAILAAKAEEREACARKIDEHATGEICGIITNAAAIDRDKWFADEATHAAANAICRAVLTIIAATIRARGAPAAPPERQG